MSKQDKKEINTDNATTNTISNINQNSQESFRRITEESRQSLNQSLDETRKNIQKNVNEAKSQIPRYTQKIQEFQEQTVQAAEDIAENYLQYQKQLVDSIQSTYLPYIENTYNQMWNNQEFFRRIPEVYSKVASNYAQNSIAMSRLYNDIAFSNVDSFKNWINNTKEQSKQLSEIGKRNIQIYENIERDHQKTV